LTGTGNYSYNFTMETKILLFTAASIAFFHTLTGPDHYIPFIAMAKARNWSALKTAVITVLCGMGHVLSSVLLGFLGIYLGAEITRLTNIESFRGGIAGWLLIIFGSFYFIWGIKKAYAERTHLHEHAHEDGTVHAHGHSHLSGHVHSHGTGKANITPWVLFTIFVFGPCEPLIPLVMYPAASRNIPALLLVTGVFTLITISTMLVMVFVSLWGIKLVSFSKAERYSHAMAGFAVLTCGFAVRFLGL